MVVPKKGLHAWPKIYPEHHTCAYVLKCTIVIEEASFLVFHSGEKKEHIYEQRLRKGANISKRNRPIDGSRCGLCVPVNESD